MSRVVTLEGGPLDGQTTTLRDSEVSEEQLVKYAKLLKRVGGQVHWYRYTSLTTAVFHRTSPYRVKAPE